MNEQHQRPLQGAAQPVGPTAQADNGLDAKLTKRYEDLQSRHRQAVKERDERARTHISAVIQALKDDVGEQPAAMPAGLFLSGMLTGLASSLEILDGGTAEKALETVTMRLAAAVGEAYLAGQLPPRPSAADGQEQGAPVSWEAVARQRERELKAAGERTVAVEQERDGAYRERAHLVALLAAMTDGAVLVPAPDVDEDGWALLYLTIGGRQCSWHISPRDLKLFEHVERVRPEDPRAQWDGHTTEAKYAHIAALAGELMQRCGPACAEQHTYSGRCEGTIR